MFSVLSAARIPPWRTSKNPAKRRAMPQEKPARKYGPGAWKPRAVFLLLVATVLVLGVAELLNAMRRPSLTRIKGPAGAHQLVIYQKGRAANREAWLMTEPQGEAGPAHCFQRIDCTEDDRTTGDLRWSFDGQALYAARRKAGSIEEVERPLWVYDFKERKLWSLDERPLASQLEMHAATESQLVDRINGHGGKGPVAASWYDLGKRGQHLFAWQITRWEKSLPVRR
jgi:hypothetical protein